MVDGGIRVTDRHGEDPGTPEQPTDALRDSMECWKAPARQSL